MVGFVDADGLRVMVDGNINGAVEGQLNALAGTATASETVMCFCRPWRSPLASVSGARLLGLASASEVSLETALRQFRVIDRALVPVQLFTVLASP